MATVQFTLYVQPGARTTAPAGWHDGLPKLRLAAPPLEGRANAALIRWLAEAFGVRQAAVRIVQGETSRIKRVAIEDPAVPLATVFGDAPVQSG
jgi:uncharacterized protein (TIGR00251 family)